MVKLKRLKINQYRNVRPGTELHFDDGVNLVLGKNGAGKTTLLALIAVVTSNDFSVLQGEAFCIEYTLATESCSANIRVESRGHQDLDDGIDAIATSAPPGYEYHVSLTGLPSHPVIELRGTPTSVVITAKGEEAREHLAFSPFTINFLLHASSELSDGLAKIFWQHIVGLHVGAISRFDEALDSFLAMTGRVPVASGAGTSPVAKLALRAPPNLGPQIHFIQFTPWEMGKVIPVAHANPGGELRVEIRQIDEAPLDSPGTLDFLERAARVMGASAAALKPEVKTIQERKDGSKIFEVEGFSFSFTRSNGTTVHHDLLSYGQKRLLAYFYYLACTEHYVIADELVNGLHHRWFEACMGAIGERQAFLTSQNPLLFEYVRFESIEQVESSFITCKTELVDGAEQLVWQNMPRPDALSFFESYKADIESVGDILITRGLW